MNAAGAFVNQGPGPRNFGYPHFRVGDDIVENNRERRKMHCNTNQTSRMEGMNKAGERMDGNRRKEDRVLLVDSVYVVVNTQPQTMGQVVEISSTGMAFTFVDLDAVSKRLASQDTLSLDLFAGGKGFFAKHVVCRLVSKIEEVSSKRQSSHSIKRVGVAFEGLTLQQQIQINQLIRRQDHKTN